MWVLERPGYMLFLFLVPALVYLRHFRRMRGGRLVFPFSLYGGAGFRAPWTGRLLLVRLSHLLFWSAFVLLIIAAAGPTTTERERVFLTRGVDIMIVLDVSPSMGAMDVQPGNRMEVARSVVRRFVEQRENDHVGLIGFSLEAGLRVPPTLNHDRVIESLDQLYIMEMGDGTAIGMALALASLHLQGTDAKEKIIILLTDGVNNAGEISPEAAAELAGSLGIRVYAIGIGSDEEAEIEFVHPEDGQTYRGTIRDGYDPVALERIADLTGGRFFSAAGGGTLEAVFNAIGTTETAERRVRVQVNRRSRHQAFLIPALFLFIVDVLIRRFLVGLIP